MPAVLACPRVGQVLTRDLHQSEGIVQLAIGQQPCIGGDAGTVELQLETAVEIEAGGVGFRFTRWVRHDCPRSNEISC
jgi:hypothetical protein